ncbi:18361_t:CDS:2 [Gigaspora rosea]|nr:18361_t:CDS:2 [Gigaspora rosea]
MYMWPIIVLLNIMMKNGSLYCGALDCGINISKQYLYQGTKYKGIWAIERLILSSEKYTRQDDKTLEEKTITRTCRGCYKTLKTKKLILEDKYNSPVLSTTNDIKMLET